MHSSLSFLCKHAGSIDDPSVKFVAEKQLTIFASFRLYILLNIIRVFDNYIHAIVDVWTFEWKNSKLVVLIIFLVSIVNIASTVVHFHSDWAEDFHVFLNWSLKEQEHV